MVPWLRRYLENPQDRAAIMTLVSFGLNAFFALIKFIYGVYLLSAWFIINAAYYFILCVARGHTLRHYVHARAKEDPKQRFDAEFLIYRRSGAFICLLGAFYFVLCLRMYFLGDSTVYTGNLIYFVALVAFCKTGFAIHGLIANRRMHNPIVTALKALNSTDALVSMVVTQCTLMASQGVEDAARYSAITGLLFSAIILATGIIMLLKRKQYPAVAAGNSSEIP